MKLLFTASPGKSQVMEQNNKENSILRNKFTHYISNLKRNYIHFLIFLFHPIKTLVFMGKVREKLVEGFALSKLI